MYDLILDSKISNSQPVTERLWQLVYTIKWRIRAVIEDMLYVNMYNGTSDRLVQSQPKNCPDYGYWWAVVALVNTGKLLISCRFGVHASQFINYVWPDRPLIIAPSPPFADWIASNYEIPDPW